MRDGIVEFAENFTGAVGRSVGVTTVVAAREYHGQMVVEGVLGYKEPGEGARAIEGWLLERLM